MIIFYPNKLILLNRSLDAVKNGISLQSIGSIEKLSDGLFTFPKMKKQTEALALAIKENKTVSIKNLNQSLPLLVENCKEQGLDFSATLIERKKQHLEDGKDLLITDLDEISDRIHDELELAVFFQLNKEQAKYFNISFDLLDEDTANKFPSISYEIEEAAKCIAFERSTASVFHSIRALEAGIRAISRCLGIEDPTKGADRSWHNMLTKIKDKIKEKWPTSKDLMAGEGRIFEELYASLSGIQNPWRNATMHLDQIYTEDQAIHIFEVVKGFMRTVSSRMDENGNPAV